RAGRVHGIAPVGYRALDSLRLEKAYRAWGADITPNDSPFEAGLGLALELPSHLPFLGPRASERAAHSPPREKPGALTGEAPDAVLAGRETLLRDGKHAGYIASAGYGCTVARPIGLGYVRNADGVDDDYVRAGTYELVVAEQRTPATVHLAPLYDPQG